MQDPLPKHIKAAFKLFNRCITRYNGVFIDKKFLRPGRDAGQILPLSAALPSSDRFIPHLAFCLQSKCCNCCPCGKEGSGNFLHEGEGFEAVAVDADGIGLQGYGAAVVGLYGTLRTNVYAQSQKTKDFLDGRTIERIVAPGAPRGTRLPSAW